MRRAIGVWLFSGLGRREALKGCPGGPRGDRSKTGLSGGSVRFPWDFGSGDRLVMEKT